MLSRFIVGKTGDVVSRSHNLDWKLCSCSNIVATLVRLIGHHLFGSWNGNRRLRIRYGEAFDILKSRTSVLPFATILDGHQKLPKDYYKEFILVITGLTLGAYFAHPLMQAASLSLHCRYPSQGSYGVSVCLALQDPQRGNKLNTPYPEKSNTPYSRYRAASGLRPYHFTYPERKLTMEEMLYKFIDEGKRKHEDMRAFICDFQTTNKILFKERNNSLIKLRFGVQELLKVINNTPMIDCEAKGLTTRGGKTTTQDAENNDTNVRTKEPLAENHDEPVESNEILTIDQPQKTNKPDAQPSNKIQTPPIPFPRRLRKEKVEDQQKKFLENLKQLHINLPFIEALAQMPKYA
ncbi:reverse transcriptase domain-containing protein [Tanacetum coccineum]